MFTQVAEVTMGAHQAVADYEVVGFVVVVVEVVEFDGGDSVYGDTAIPHKPLHQLNK